MMTNDELVDIVANARPYAKIKTPDPRVLSALRSVDRRHFIPRTKSNICVADSRALLGVVDSYKAVAKDGDLEGLGASLEMLLANVSVIEIPSKLLAYTDRPVVIGEEQTCSAPSVVAIMTDILEIEEGMRALEIGAGCGYHAAVVLQLLGSSGYLVTVEYRKRLFLLARKNLYSYFGEDARLRIEHADGSTGFEDEMPFDRIYITAGVNMATFKSRELARQLNPEAGILLFPESGGHLVLQRYKNQSMTSETRYPGFIFVDLAGKNT